MFAFGAVLVWAICFALLGLPVALLALWAWWLWQGVQRRRPRPRRSPYDDAYERALWELASARGALDARRAVAELG